MRYGLQISISLRDAIEEEGKIGGEGKEEGEEGEEKDENEEKAKEEEKEKIEIHEEKKEKSEEKEEEEIQYKEKKERPERNFPTVTDDCPICWEEGKVGFSLSPCSHFECLRCWEEFFQNKIMGGEILNIKCPHPDCDNEITSEVIEMLVTPDLFAKYQQFTFLSRLRLEPNARYCPNSECGKPLIGNPKSPDFPKLTCEDCHTEFCFHCGLTWHRGTCEKAKREAEKNLSKAEKKRRAQEEKDTAKYLKKNKTCKCSKCGALVQKSSGCNHMECTCGHEFCWLCGETILISGCYPPHYKVDVCVYFYLFGSPVGKCSSLLHPPSSLSPHFFLDRCLCRPSNVRRG